jgi:predicted phosphatase
MKLIAIQIYYDSYDMLTAKGNVMIAGFLSWNMKLMAIQIYYDSCVILTAKRNVMIAGFLSWNMKLMAIEIYYDSCVILFMFQLRKPAIMTFLLAVSIAQLS